ncbi:hypothetical protein [Campylobacter sp. US33a]|uniref:hypothetical protein n=1 Tax=Campylobacter sp. US33a TaxID=2498120 RepID=UPI001068B972|nr:hypothetical protein [Campylobacter sp. US33a]TEY00369.1 hypothetical protein ELQ16_09305 [Campylobacter sp. US33a]
MFFSYIPLSFGIVIFLLFIFFLMKIKSQKILKNKNFLNEYQICKNELNIFKNAVENFVKNKEVKSILISANTLKFVVKYNAFGNDYTKQFKQILQNYPNEKEFNIEINHFSPQKI